MEPRGAERFFETTEIGSTLKRKALGELVCVWGAGLVSECREGFWVDTGVFFHYWEELGDQIPGSSGPSFFFFDSGGPGLRNGALPILELAVVCGGWEPGWVRFGGLSTQI